MDDEMRMVSSLSTICLSQQQEAEFNTSVWYLFVLPEAGVLRCHVAVFQTYRILSRE